MEQTVIIMMILITVIMKMQKNRCSDANNVIDYIPFVDINNSETSSDVAKVLSAKRSYSGQRIIRNSYCTPIYKIVYIDV